MKMNLLLFSAIFVMLIGLVSAAPSISVSSPTSLINYGKLNGNLLLNFTATDTNLASCWYNYNNTNTTVGEISQAHSGSYSSSSAETNSRGINITALRNASSAIIEKESGSNATKVWLYFTNGTYLANGTFVGDYATVSYNFVNGTSYLLMFDGAGSPFLDRLSSGVSFPIETTAARYVNGIYFNSYGDGTSKTPILDSGFLHTIQSITFPCLSEISNPRNITLTAQKNLTIYANDTAGNLASQLVTWDYKVFENSRTYNSTAYETGYETYSVNATANSSLTSVSLLFNNTEYLATYSSGLWSKSLDIPTTNVGNNSIQWRFTYSGSTINSDVTYQSVSNAVFTSCNATYPTKFLNITFKDESTLASIGGLISQATFEYYLGSGAVTKTYSFTELTSNTNYTFCATPNVSFYVSPRVPYYNTSYPQRVYQPGILTLTNTTTNKILYLLGSSSGLYVTFQVQNAAEQALENVFVIANRTISGDNINLSQGYTDAAGAVTFWVNPDAEYSFIFSKDNYNTFTYTTYPTQSSYTINLGSGTAVTEYDFTRGINYTTRPSDNYLNKSTNYVFNFTLSSSYWDIDSFGFILRNSTDVLSSQSSTGTGTVSATVNTGNNSVIFMDYFYVVNGSYTNLTRAFYVQDMTGREFSLWKFFEDFRTYVGTDDGIFGLTNNSISLNIVIFIFILLTTGLISNKFSMTSPAPVLGVLFFLVFFFDVVLGLMFNPPLATQRGIEHFPTIFIGIILTAFIVKEVSQ